MPLQFCSYFVKFRRSRNNFSEGERNFQASMTQPPLPAQRKVKYLNSLKTVQSEQNSKLQQKQQLEHELLDDIRSYSKLRATIEKDYAQALQKLVSQFMQKFIPKDNEKEESKTLKRTPFGLWRKMLEETEVIANERMKISQSLLADVAENVKSLKANRMQTVKKCAALSEKLQAEMQTSVQDLVNSQKTYYDLQKIAVQSIEQHNEAQEKLKKGATRFFQSKGTLEKNASKLKERREVCDKRSTMARNDYLLNVAAVNAHQQRYYATDLPELIALQDGNIYEKFKDYFFTITSLEAESTEKSFKSFTELKNEVSLLQRAYAIQLFLRMNPVFTKCIPYEFQSFADDKVQTISDSDGAGLHLNKEARKWALRVAKGQKIIRKKTKELQGLQRANSTGDKAASVEDILKEAKEAKESKEPTVEQTRENLLEEIRHLEVLRTKAEGRLDALRQAGINVDEWLQSAAVEAEQEDEDNENQANDQQSLEDTWDDDEDSMFSPEFSDDEVSTSSTHSNLCIPAVALYAFQAQSQEELSITEQEELEVIERDMDGWCKGRNKSGQVGYIPESYIELRRGSEARSRGSSDARSIGATSIGTDRRPSDSRSFGDTIVTSGTNFASGEASSPPNSVGTSKGERDTASSFSSDRSEEHYICLVKALYDYEATDDEELSFKEGDIIMVTNKDDEGIDDGWWEGMIQGRKGVFPSLVVEEFKSETTDGAHEWPVYERRRLNTDTYATVPRSKTPDNRRVLSMYGHETLDVTTSAPNRPAVPWLAQPSDTNNNP